MYYLFYLFLFVMLGACGPKGSQHEGPDLIEQKSDSEVTDPCLQVCVDNKKDSNWAQCYSCRCKAAFDGHMPSSDELTCSKGKEINVYNLSEIQGETSLIKLTTMQTHCVNPPRLPDSHNRNGGCFPGSRLGQLDRGPIHFKWICRREHFVNDFKDSDEPFDDLGIIGHNDRNGATCFWDDKDNIFSLNAKIAIDLASGDEKKIANFNKNFQRQEGEVCITCHDNNPFLYSPYLASTNWTYHTDTALGFYHLVHSEFNPGIVGSHLVSPDAAACTSCHRIGYQATRGFLSKDAMGEIAIDSLEPEIAENLKRPMSVRKWGAINSKNGDQQFWSHWMPDPALLGGKYPTWQEWEKSFGKAKQILQICDQNPQNELCKWAPIPDRPAK